MKKSYSNDNYVQIMDPDLYINYTSNSDIKLKTDDERAIFIREWIGGLTFLAVIVLVYFAIVFTVRGVIYIQAKHEWNKYSNIVPAGRSIRTSPAPLFNASQVNPNEGYSFARKPKF